jgi:hypothetical protein
MAANKDVDFERPVLFKTLFGPVYETLPSSWQILHDVTDTHHHQGKVEVARGKGLVARFLCFLLKLPKSGSHDAQLILEKTCHNGRGAERWVRRFGSSKFSTILTMKPGLNEGAFSDGERAANCCFYLLEKFGPIRFHIKLDVKGEIVKWCLLGWRFYVLPLPRYLVPISNTTEYEDEAGRYHFDIDLSLKGYGRLIAYRGWLVPLIASDADK